jgi:hypothetical protein
MDEKDLGKLFASFAPYSYMDYPRISVDPSYNVDDITVTRRATEMPETFWDQPGLDMNLDMDALAELAQRLMNDENRERPLTNLEAYKKPEQSDLEKLLAKKELSVAETLELYKRGLKPYFVTTYPNTNMLVELVLENENDRTSPIKWLNPKIAEKIQTRYKEINDLVQEKGAAIRAIDSKIEDLKLRISMIEETGTDLII